MYVRSKKGERVVTLDARERRVMQDAHDILAELGELASDQRAEDAAGVVGTLLAVYRPPVKQEAAP